MITIAVDIVALSTPTRTSVRVLDMPDAGATFGWLVTETCAAVRIQAQILFHLIHNPEREANGQEP